jgi:hypothetical protein
VRLEGLRQASDIVNRTRDFRLVSTTLPAVPRAPCKLHKLTCYKVSLLGSGFLSLELDAWEGLGSDPLVAVLVQVLFCLYEQRRVKAAHTLSAFSIALAP